MLLLLILYFIWKVHVVKGDFLKNYWPTRGELKVQDWPVWLPNTSPNLYHYGENFMECNF